MMSDEAKAARRAYYQKWRRSNPDKVKATSERYWEKKAREQLAPHTDDAHTRRE